MTKNQAKLTFFKVHMHILIYSPQFKSLQQRSICSTTHPNRDQGYQTLMKLRGKEPLNYRWHETDDLIALSKPVEVIFESARQKQEELIVITGLAARTLPPYARQRLRVFIEELSEDHWPLQLSRVTPTSLMHPDPIIDEHEARLEVFLARVLQQEPPKTTPKPKVIPSTRQLLAAGLLSILIGAWLLIRQQDQSANQIGHDHVSAQPTAGHTNNDNESALTAQTQTHSPKPQDEPHTQNPTALQNTNGDTNGDTKSSLVNNKPNLDDDNDGHPDADDKFPQDRRSDNSEVKLKNVYIHYLIANNFLQASTVINV